MKALKFTFLLLTLTFLFLPSLAHGISPENPTTKTQEILPPIKDILGGKNAVDVKIPEEKFREKVIPSVINILLGLAGSIAFIVFTVAGVMLIVAHGNEELHTKVKNIFIYAIIGLTLIALSYAIIYGVFTLRFQSQ